MSKIIEKWHEQKQEGATPKLLEEILDKNKLIEVKELWWSDPFYTDTATATRKDDYLKERSRLFEEIIGDNINASVWNVLVSKLNLVDKNLKYCRKYPDNRRQRLCVLDCWTLENGYNKASNSVLQCAFEDAKNYALPQSESQQRNVTSSNKIAKYDIGLFHHDLDKCTDTDIKAFNRIKAALMLKYNVVSFEEYSDAGGMAKSEVGVQFSNECLCVFWIVSPGALEDEKYTKYHIDVLHHMSISTRPYNFICLFPEHLLNCKPVLPPQFQAYTSLDEDHKFMERVEKTFERIKNKFIQHRKKHDVSKLTPPPLRWTDNKQQ